MLTRRGGDPGGLKHIRGDNGGLGTAHRGPHRDSRTPPAQPRTQPAPTSPHFSSHARGLWPPSHLPAYPREPSHGPGRSTKYELGPVQRTREAESGGGGEPWAREPQGAPKSAQAPHSQGDTTAGGDTEHREGGVTRGAQTQSQSHPAQTQHALTRAQHTRAQTQHTRAQTQINREMLCGTKAPHT